MHSKLVFGSGTSRTWKSLEHPASVKELITRHVSLLSMNVRYVPMSEDGKIGINEAEAAVRIL